MMNTLAIQMALQTQTQLVYKGTLANDHTVVATALKQIKKLVQRLMILENVAPSKLAKKNTILEKGMTELDSYINEIQENITHDIEILPEAIEGELAKAVSKSAQKICREFGKIAY